MKLGSIHILNFRLKVEKWNFIFLVGKLKNILEIYSTKPMCFQSNELLEFIQMNIDSFNSSQSWDSDIKLGSEGPRNSNKLYNL